MMSSSVHPACSSFVAQNPDGRELGLAGEPDPISRLEGGWRHGPAREDDAANRGGIPMYGVILVPVSCFLFAAGFERRTGRQS